MGQFADGLVCHLSPSLFQFTILRLLLSFLSFQVLLTHFHLFYLTPLSLSPSRLPSLFAQSTSQSKPNPSNTPLQTPVLPTNRMHNPQRRCTALSRTISGKMEKSQECKGPVSLPWPLPLLSCPPVILPSPPSLTTNTYTQVFHVPSAIMDRYPSGDVAICNPACRGEFHPLANFTMVEWPLNVLQ